MTIPYGSRYTATLSVKAWIPVSCEHCTCTFVYRTEKAGRGDALSVFWRDTAGAKELAKKQAVADVEKALINTADPVPCPQCGRYQARMVRALKRARIRGGWIAALVVSVLWLLWTVVLFAQHALTRSFWAIGTSSPVAFSGIVVVGCVGAGYVLAVTFDPARHARKAVVPAELRASISAEQFRSIQPVGYVLIRD